MCLLYACCFHIFNHFEWQNGRRRWLAIVRWMADWLTGWLARYQLWSVLRSQFPCANSSVWKSTNHHDWSILLLNRGLIPANALSPIQPIHSHHFAYDMTIRYNYKRLCIRRGFYPIPTHHGLIFELELDWKWRTNAAIVFRLYIISSIYYGLAHWQTQCLSYA